MPSAKTIPINLFFNEVLLQINVFLIIQKIKSLTAAQMDLSMFQLFPYMTRTLDLDRPAFHSYMDTLFETLRGITQKVLLDGEGKPLLTPDETQQRAMDEYLTLVYDGLLGSQYANDTLYGD